MRHPLVVLLAGLLAGVAVPRTGAATLLELRDVATLARVSDACVRGRVVGEEVAWSRDGGVLVTTFTLEPLETLTGEAPSGPLRITRVGGALDGVALSYEGMPELTLGEHVVVFLRAHGEGGYLIVALKQGVVRERAGRWARDLSGVLGAPRGGEDWSLEALRTAVGSWP